MKDSHDLDGKRKMPAAAIKRPTKKKPKDKPKRPLSAYNYFFKEQREKTLKVVLAEDPSKVVNEPGTEDYLDEDTIARLRKEGGKVSFEEMGKLIGQRWKNIDPDRLAKYSELASEDTERYKKEMQTYNGRQEAKMRSEALKPPTTFPTSAGIPGREGPGGKPPGPPGEPARPGYPEAMSGMNSAFGNPQAMGGGFNPYEMQYGGYGMGMGASMYGPYGGYPGAMGGGQEAMGGVPGSLESSPYGARGAMYGQHLNMMGGGFQGSMMGYGGGGQDPYASQYPAPDQQDPYAAQYPADQQDPYASQYAADQQRMYGSYR